MAEFSERRLVDSGVGTVLESPLLPDRQETWEDEVAGVVSIIFAPPFVAAYMITFVVVVSGVSEAWRWAGLYLAQSVLAPLGYLLWLRQNGLVSDLDVKERAERFRPLAFTVVAMVLACVVFWAGGAPPLLRGLAVVAVLLLGVVLVVTTRWKISMHGAAIGAFTALLLIVIGWGAVPILLIVPVVAWARVHLRRHTPAQAIAGIALGGFITWSVLAWTLMH